MRCSSSVSRNGPFRGREGWPIVPRERPTSCSWSSSDVDSRGGAPRSGRYFVLAGAAYLDLARPLAAVDRFPALKLVRAIREQTGPADPILVFPLDCQLYAIAGHRISGRLSVYLDGFFSDPQYHSENLASVLGEMPKVVVLPSDGKKRTSGDAWAEIERRGRQAHQYLERFVREQYRRVIYDDGESMVLGRDCSALPDRGPGGRDSPSDVSSEVSDFIT